MSGARSGNFPNNESGKSSVSRAYDDTMIENSDAVYSNVAIGLSQPLPPGHLLTPEEWQWRFSTQGKFDFRENEIISTANLENILSRPDPRTIQVSVDAFFLAWWTLAKNSLQCRVGTKHVNRLIEASAGFQQQRHMRATIFVWHSQALLRRSDCDHDLARERGKMAQA